MRLPGDVVFSAGGPLMCWDLLVKLRRKPEPNMAPYRHSKSAFLPGCEIVDGGFHKKPAKKRPVGYRPMRLFGGAPILQKHQKKQGHCGV